MFRFYTFITCCIIATLIPLLPQPHTEPDLSFPGWPASFERKRLQETALTPAEKAFQSGFPGRIGRFSDGRREIIIRWITRESRKLHPAIDCFKGNNYQITPLPIYIDSEGNYWGAFKAVRGEVSLTVHERIYDSSGKSWSDISSWYWSVLFKQTTGPWWNMIVAEQDLANIPN